MWFSKNYSDYVGRRVREGEILLVIDEAQLLFNSREWVKSDRAEWCSFFTQHRKLGYEVVLVAQFDRMLDRQIRSLIEYEWIHRKVSNFGNKGKIMSLFCGGRLFVAVKVWYPLKEKALSVRDAMEESACSVGVHQRHEQQFVARVYPRLLLRRRSWRKSP